jgi:hypothetical protein
MKILVKTSIDGKSVECEGAVEIHWRKEPQAYVSWKVFTPTLTIVSKSENFLYKEANNANEELVNRIKERIHSYRVGRKRIFEEVRICKE